MTRLLLASTLAGALGAIGLGTPVGAQIVDTQFISAASTDCSTASSCASFDLGSNPSMTFTITGTFSATLLFEATADGQTWVALPMTNLATGATGSTGSAGSFQTSNLGILKVRVRASAYVSGNVKVIATRGWSLSSRSGGSGTSFFSQDAPNVIALTNGTNPQTLRIYNQDTASDDLYLQLGWSGSNATITAVKTGAAPAPQIVIDAQQGVQINQAGVTKCVTSSTISIVCNNDVKSTGFQGVTTPTKTGTYTATFLETFIPCDATTAGFTITLPTPAAANAGRSWTIKKVDASANVCTVATPSGLIDGAATYVGLSAQYKTVTIVADNTGANYWITNIR